LNLKKITKMSSNDNSFKELVKLDAVNLINKELGKLLSTVSKNEDNVKLYFIFLY